MNELDKFLFYDKPVPYKNLYIYPALMSEYIDFHMYSNCLLLDKNSIPDAKIISMSYLRYLYYASKNDNAPYMYMLRLLLTLVLHLDKEIPIKFYTRDDKAFFSIGDKPAKYNDDGIIINEKEINFIEYDSNDFNEMMNIIIEQNCLEIIDETIQKEVRDAMEEVKEYKMKQNSRKMCSLEEQMVCVLISTSLKLEDIYNLTIRKFEKILKRADNKLHYQIYLSAELSGMVTFKPGSEAKHWLDDLTPKDKYSDTKVDMDDMRNKINMNDKMKK